jgi:hypothetical protein
MRNASPSPHGKQPGVRRGVYVPDIPNLRGLYSLCGQQKNHAKESCRNRGLHSRSFSTPAGTGGGLLKKSARVIRRLGLRLRFSPDQALVNLGLLRLLQPGRQ